MQFHSVVPSLKEENGHYTSTQGGGETFQSWLWGQGGLEEGVVTSQETNTKKSDESGETGRRRQAELGEKSFRPEIWASCTARTFKQSNNGSSAKPPFPLYISD